MICITPCTAVLSGSPYGVLCGWAHLARCLKETPNDLHNAVPRRPIFLAPCGVLWRSAHLAQGSLKRYQMICETLSSAVYNPHPPEVICAGGLTSPRVSKEWPDDLHNPLHRRTILLPLWCFVRVASPRPWVSKEIPDDLHYPGHRRTILIPVWCVVRVGSPGPGVSKEIPDDLHYPLHRRIPSSSPGGVLCGRAHLALGSLKRYQNDLPNPLHRRTILIPCGVLCGRAPIKPRGL